MKIPKECYEEYGKDLDGCSTQELEGCGRCILANPKVISRAKAACRMTITIEEAIKMLKQFAIVDAIQEDYDVIDMAIEALEKQIPKKPEDFTTATRETIIYKLSGYDVEVALKEMRIDYTEEQLHSIINYINERSLPIDWTEYMILMIERAIEEGVIGNIQYNPEKGNGYYYPNIGYTVQVAYKNWCNSPTDRRIKKYVGCYRTKEEALAKAKELWGLED